jgi:hypothetical protein
MSAKDDWYTSADWDDAAQELFDTKIRRSRQPWSKWGYFRSKANALFFSKDPDKLAAAITLLRRALDEVADIEPDWASSTYHRLGQVTEATGDASLAEQYYRQAIAACTLGDRTLVGRSYPEQDLARLLNAHGTRQAEHEAERLFDTVYEHHAQHNGGWLPRVSELTPIDQAGEAYQDPDDAAEAIVVYHHTEPGMDVLFRPDRTALTALDALFAGPRRPRVEYQQDFLRKFAIELGAYLGRVLVHETDGRWRVASTLIDSRITIDGRDVDPFTAGFKAVWYERSLVQLFDTLVTRD